MNRPADLVLVGGTVVNAGGRQAATVVVRAGLVSDVLPASAPVPPHARAIDVFGKAVIPGGVDPHCHVGQRLGEVSMLDDYAGASTAALWGGTTTIIDFAIPEPGEDPLQAVQARVRSAERARCDTALHGSVIAWDGRTARQLKAMAELGVLTTKLFTTYRGGVMADVETIRAVMTANESRGGVTLIHAEANHTIEDAQQAAKASGRGHSRWHAAMRPEAAELMAVERILLMAEQSGAAVYFVHQSTPAVVDRVAEARARGVRAYSEVCPHYLLLDDSVYAGPGPERFVCCPPLRARSTVRALRQRVLDGLVDTIGSDHCCYSTEQKVIHADDAVQVPNGLPGVETRLSAAHQALVVEGGMALEDLVALVSTTPARLNGLRNKGVVAPGADADLVVLDQDLTRTPTADSLHMRTDWTPFEDVPLTGWPVVVVSAGRVVLDRDGFHDPGPVGRFIRAQAQIDGTGHRWSPARTPTRAPGQPTAERGVTT